MNLFRTEIFPQKSDFKIDYKTSLLLTGSCFAKNIGEIFDDFGFKTIVNPFGVLYNPLSVAKNLKILFSDKIYDDSDLIFKNNKWVSLDHYTGFSNQDKSICLTNINEQIERARHFIKDLNCLIITFGTSWVYRFKKTGKIVANCHKIQASEFERNFVKIDDIVNEFRNTISDIQVNLPDLKIIFTVSPIRHWKDGASGNLVSKANLILAVHQLINETKNTSYFPSYEIMMDDLRDYRFYGEDMIHPSKQAIEYIWQKFIETYIDKDTEEIMNEVNKVNKAAAHNPTETMSAEYQNFITKMINKARDLQSSHQVNLEKKLTLMQNKIK